ncbi:MAG: DeoR family transcriptional regulator [Desulfobacterales bacterium]|nr:DeoR family transcriptional regulator [Desulfobacterales bacterium]
MKNIKTLSYSDKSGKDPVPGFSMSRRQNQILEWVRRDGFVSIEDLAHNFQVTPQTIRRDINKLSENGLLRRHHGGAGLTTSTENYAYTTRKVLCLPEKRGIARLLARHIPDRASLFLNIGTTIEEVAKVLLDKERLRIITNNLNAATILSGNENFEVIVAGGVVRSKDRGITGHATIDFIRQFKVDFGIIGISGIDMDGTLLDFDYREVGVAQTIIANSRKVFLAADHTKFGRNAMVRLTNISEIDALFTDRRPPDSLIEILTISDGRIYIADSKA